MLLLFTRLAGYRGEYGDNKYRASTLRSFSRQGSQIHTKHSTTSGVIRSRQLRHGFGVSGGWATQDIALVPLNVVWRDMREDTA